MSVQQSTSNARPVLQVCTPCAQAVSTSTAAKTRREVSQMPAEAVEGHALRLQQQAASARARAKYLRGQLRQAVRKAERLTTIDRSNARLAKELAVAHNSEVHSLDGNIDALELPEGRFTAEQIYAMAPLYGVVAAVLPQDLVVRHFEEMLFVFVPNDDDGGATYTAFEPSEAADLYEDMDMLDEYAIVLASRHNRFMHALNGNTSKALAPETAPAQKLKIQRPTPQTAPAQTQPAPAQTQTAAAHKEKALRSASRKTAALKSPSIPQPHNAEPLVAALLKSVAALAAPAAPAAVDAGEAPEARKPKLTDAQRIKRDAEIVHTRLDDAFQNLQHAIKHCRWISQDALHTVVSFAMVYVSPENKTDKWWTAASELLTEVPYLEPKPQVASTVAGLITPAVPHTVLECKMDLSDIRYTVPFAKFRHPDHTNDDDDIEEYTACLPAMERHAQNKLDDFYVDCKVTMKMFGFGWPLCPYKTEKHRVRISVSSFLAILSQRGVSGIDFETDLRSVRAMLERHDDVARTNPYDFTRTTYFHDFVFTGFLLNALGPRTLSSSEMQYSLVRNVLYDVVIRGRPAPAGIYLVGYHVQFKELFPTVRSDQIAEFLNRSAGFISAARAGTIATAKEIKKLIGHAMQAPASIIGLHAAFPAPTGGEDAITAFCKRLAQKVPDRCKEANLTTKFLSECLISELKADSAGYERRSTADLATIGHQHCETKGWTPGSQDYDDFWRGYRAGCGVDDQGTYSVNAIEHTEEFLKNNGFNPNEYSANAFFKAEAQPPEAKKGLRFIVAPPVVIRGYTQAILQTACDKYAYIMTKHQDKHSIKHQTVREWSAQLMKVFEHQQYFAETDFTSFESNIDPWMLRLEGTVLAALADDSLESALVEDWYAYLVRSPVFCTNAFFTFVLTPMRKSGEYQTSSANNICNLIWIAGIYLPVLFPELELRPIRFGTDKEAADKALWQKAFHRWFTECIFYFEGDDGLIHIGHQLTPKEEKLVMDAVTFFGVRLKFAFHRLGNKLNFCGTTVMPFGDGSYTTIVNVLEILANATCLFDVVSDDSALKASIVAYGKVCSYASLYADIPIVNTFCTQAMSFYRSNPVVEKALALVRNAAKESHVTPATYIRQVSESSRIPKDEIKGTPLETVLEMDPEATAAARMLCSQIEYFSRELDDEFLEALVPDSTLHLYSTVLPPELVTAAQDSIASAASVLSARVRAAIDTEVGNLGVSFVELCNKAIVTAFDKARAAGDKFVRIDIPAIRAIMSDKLGHRETVEVELDDARTWAANRAEALIQQHNSVSLVEAASDVARQIPTVTTRVITAGVVPAFLSLLVSGYIGLPTVAILTFLAALVSFFVLLPFNGMSVWKTIPKCVLVCTAVPVCYCVYMCYLGLMSVQWLKKSARACKQRNLERLERITCFFQSTLRGSLSFKQALKIPRGFRWYNVMVLVNNSPLHVGTIAVATRDVANGMFASVHQLNFGPAIIETQKPEHAYDPAYMTDLAELFERDHPDMPFIEFRNTSSIGLILHCGAKPRVIL